MSLPGDVVHGVEDVFKKERRHVPYQGVSDETGRTAYTRWRPAASNSLVEQTLTRAELRRSVNSPETLVVSWV